MHIVVPIYRRIAFNNFLNRLQKRTNNVNNINYKNVTLSRTDIDPLKILSTFSCLGIYF